MRNKLKVLLNIRIIYALYTGYKKLYRFAHKAITATKAFISFVIWSIAKRHGFYKELSDKYGITNVKPYTPLRWKHGAKYFVGEKNKKQVFVKAPGKIDTSWREIYAIKTARERSEFLCDHLPKLITQNMEDYVLIEELEKGIRLDRFNDSWSDDKKQDVIEQLFAIYKELKRCGIIHMDIRPANFILDQKENKTVIKLIDFGFALVDTNDVYMYIKDDETCRSIIKNLGSSYSLRNKSWDDAYSFLLTMKEINPSLMRDRYDIWKQLNEDMGSRMVAL